MSRWGIWTEPGSFLGFIFLLFPMKVAGGYTHSNWEISEHFYLFCTSLPFTANSFSYFYGLKIENGSLVVSALKKNSCVSVIGSWIIIRAYSYDCTTMQWNNHNKMGELTKNLQRSRYLYPCLLILAAASALKNKWEK